MEPRPDASAAGNGKVSSQYVSNPPSTTVIICQFVLFQCCLHGYNLYDPMLCFLQDSFNGDQFETCHYLQLVQEPCSFLWPTPWIHGGEIDESANHCLPH